MLIISYLCLKNEKKEYKNIFDNIIEYSKSKNGIFFSEILKYFNIKDKIPIFEEFKENNINISLFNNEINNNENLWENNFINLYYYYYHSINLISQKKYIKIKKELFSWNGIYSNKILFYTNKRKEFKYKISTHLTQNFINPILIPILDFNYYTSNQYNYQSLCLDQFKSYINLSIFKKEEIKIKNITNYLIIPCCLIKLTHHIKGFILINNKIPNYFEFFNSEEGCNDKIDSITKLCYGSYKNIDNNKSYYIKIFINDINMIFERKYYYSNNSIEIFTNQNKSYYFNFGIDNKNIDNKTKFLKLIKSPFINIEISSILNNKKNE